MCGGENMEYEELDMESNSPTPRLTGSSLPFLLLLPSSPQHIDTDMDIELRKRSPSMSLRIACSRAHSIRIFGYSPLSLRLPLGSSSCLRIRLDVL